MVDLGQQPLANAYLRKEDLALPEPTYPLHARVCTECLLVQVADVVTASDLFLDYAYFSSYSDTWLDHARSFARRMRDELALESTSTVIEVASNGNSSRTRSRCRSTSRSTVSRF